MKPASTLAALLFAGRAQPSIEDIADRLLDSSIANSAATRSVSWDCDDLLFLDFNGLRIALQEVDADANQPGYHCLAVGAQPGMPVVCPELCADLARDLVNSLNQHYFVTAVLWQTQEGVLDAGAVDAFADTLDPMFGHLEEILTETNVVPEANDASGIEIIPPQTQIAAQIAAQATAQNTTQEQQEQAKRILEDEVAFAKLAQDLYRQLEADARADAPLMRIGKLHINRSKVLEHAQSWFDRLDKSSPAT